MRHVMALIKLPQHVLCLLHDRFSAVRFQRTCRVLMSLQVFDAEDE